MNTVMFHISSLQLDDVIPDYKFAIWGEFYMEIEGKYFPVENWTDATSSILDMWTECMIDFVKNKKRQCTLCFMDGPYIVRVYARAKNQITVICKEDGGNEFVRVITDLSQFLQELLDCTFYFMKECRQRAGIYYTKNETCKKLEVSCRVLKEIMVSLK